MNSKNVKLKVMALAVTLAWTGIANAEVSEEDELALAYGDKTVVSIATGSQQSLRRAPAVATVITTQDIEAMGATNLDQVLQNVPGLHVSVNSQGYASLYSFRGIYTTLNPQVLMLVNGIPLNVAWAGNRGLGVGRVPLENVARIEVIRGPGSALYGADAFSGVINIITKTVADIKGTEYGARIGSFNSKDGWIQYGGKLGVLDAVFYLGASKTDGPKNPIEKDLQSLLDPVFGTHASLAPGNLDLPQKKLIARTDLSYADWRLRAAYEQNHVGFAVGINDNLDPGSELQNSKFYSDLTYQKANFIKNWDMSAIFEYSDVQERPSDQTPKVFPNGGFANTFPNGVLGNPARSERHIGAGISGIYNGFNAHRIRIGTGYRLEDLYKVTESKNFTVIILPNGAPFPVPLPGGLIDATGDPNLVYLLPTKRRLTYLFAQDEWTITKDWTLTAGVRKDRYSDFGSTTNPRLALVWDYAYNFVIKALHGRAFRAPSFVEQYEGENPVQRGLQTIRPETIATNELVFAWQPKPNLQTNLTFFHYREKDIIRFVPNQAGGGSTAANAGDQTGRGLELEATWDVSRTLRITGNYSLQHSIDESTKKDAGLAPHRRLFGRADWRFEPGWQFGATVNHVADRQRESGDTRPQIANYTTVDLSLRREKLLGNWEGRVSVQNLFNRDAREPSQGNITFDLPLPTRSFYIKLQHSL